MTLIDTILAVLAAANALYLTYLLGEVREARRQSVIQDQLTDRLVAAYKGQFRYCKDQ